jgi:hypothetical protein
LDWSSVIEAAATVVLAFFAGVQLYAEHQRRKSTRDAAGTRASAIAFLLRRQLRSWLGREPHLGRGIGDWLPGAVLKQTLRGHLDTAEQRMTALASLSHDLPRSAAEAVQGGFVHFLAGAGAVNRIADLTVTLNDGTLHIPQWPSGWEVAAHEELGICIGLLETHVIAAALLGLDRGIGDLPPH